MLDIEDTLRRELGAVADGLQVPARPPLPAEPAGFVHRHWQPLLVAAAVLLVLVGVVTVVGAGRDDRHPQPAPTPPSPSRTDLPRTTPEVPYVLGQHLYVGGEPVTGDWWSVRGTSAGWLGQRTDQTWWWGRGTHAEQMTGHHDVPPAISPSGRYVAEIRSEGDTGLLTGFDTGFAGEGLGGEPIERGDPQAGTAVSIRAVTDDGRVVVQGADHALLWRPLVEGGTVDLTRTAPGQVVLAGTAAGLVVTDGEGGEPYLADLSNDGELTRTATLPAHDDLVVSPDGRWLAYADPGTLGGEVTTLSSLGVQALDGTGRARLDAPDGFGFEVMRWAWEDDDHMVVPVLRERDRLERIARCTPAPARCVLIDAGP